jgi:hypothetical protein
MPFAEGVADWRLPDGTEPVRRARLPDRRALDRAVEGGGAAGDIADVALAERNDRYAG